MLVFLTTLLAILPSILRSRAALELENMALRHQIGVLQRSASKRPKLTSGDRLLGICLSTSGATGAQRWPSSSHKRSWLGIEPAFASSGPGRSGTAQQEDPSFRARSEISSAKWAGSILFGVHPASMANYSNSASFAYYKGRPTRRNRSWNRGSDRKPSMPGSM